MALLQERLLRSEAVDADALIQEARRLRRRRWRIGLTAVLALGGSALGYGLTVGGTPPSNPDGHSVGDPAAAAAPSVVARWTDLSSGGGLPGGAEITSVIRFDGRLVAAGDYFGGGAALASPSCTDACNPVVWTSTDGSHWSIALAKSASESVPGERLVKTPTELLMFNTGEASTTLWRSTDGRSWSQVAIPTRMSGLTLSGATWGHSRTVAIFSNKFAGGPDAAYGNADTIWTSTNGTTWSQDPVPGTPRFTSLTTTPTGFLASGTSRATGHPTLWRSSNGLVWKAAAVSVPAGELLVAASGNDLAAEDGVPGLAAPKATVQLWQSTSGGKWTRAVVRGGPVQPPTLATTASPLATTAEGFVISGATSTEMWSSSTGATWSPVLAKDVPSTKYQVQELFPDGSGLLAVVASKNTRSSPSAPTSSIWHVTLSTAR